MPIKLSEVSGLRNKEALDSLPSVVTVQALLICDF